MKKILICCPTYNESDNIEILCKKVFKINNNFHLLIIDDNSPDGTYKIVEKLKSKYKNLYLLKRKKKLGLGSAIREGMRYAEKSNYNALLTLDADLSHNPEEIPLLVKKSKLNDFVIGSRYVIGGKSDYEGYRDLVSRLANKLCRFFLNMPFNEFTTSFRLYNYKCLKILNKSSLKSNGYSAQIEFLFYIYKAGLKCCEVPISFRHRYKGNSKIPRLQVLYSSFKLIELFIKNIIIPKKKL